MTSTRYGPKSVIEGLGSMGMEKLKDRLRAFRDFFLLFSGISTRSGLSRTQRRPVRLRGLFLYRGTAKDDAQNTPGKQ